MPGAPGPVLLWRNKTGPEFFYPGIIALCLAAVIAAYFANNPLLHGGWFLTRSLINWLPLGLTYAFLCMGRYNIIVAKGALGTLMCDQDLGIIFAVGTATYALSFFVNSPLIDKELVDERGVFGAIFGTFISSGAYFAFDWAAPMCPAGCSAHARGPAAALLCGLVLIVAIVMPVFLLAANRRLVGGDGRHGLHWHHRAPVRHNGDGFRRAQGHRHLLRSRGRLCLRGQ